ncbi:trypsin inhibitor like cysteine rich domain-containing protein [Phthorimaea operculella]|nr:trypsin inhibitor like cysteine rich domain-containing protein [Phthorimaea operculella]
MAKYLVVALVSTFWILFINSELTKRSLTCAGDEMHVECSHCGPKTCEELGYPKPCKGGTGVCNPECVCLDGHVRNDNGSCIAKKECPSCGGDKNATSGCGNHCGRTCSDHTEVNKTCLSGCRYNGCDCKEGYVYHEGLTKCVLPVDCCSIQIAAEAHRSERIMSLWVPIQRLRLQRGLCVPRGLEQMCTAC